MMFQERSEQAAETALGGQLQKAGYSRAEMELYPAALKFFNSGATMERYVEVGDRAAKAISKPAETMESYKRVGVRAKADVDARRADSKKHVEKRVQELKKTVIVAVKRLIDATAASDGRLWGDIRPYEFHGMERDAKIARAVDLVLGPLNPRQAKQPLRELLTDDQFKKVLKLAGQEAA